MKEKFPCEFICDLLPGYIDGLTSEVSNEIIESHILGCKACGKYLSEYLKKVQREEEESIELAYLIKLNQNQTQKIKILTCVIILTLLLSSIFLYAIVEFHVIGIL